MTSNQDTRSGCRLHNFNQFEHFESPIDLWHGEGVQRLFYLALNLILLLMGSNKGRLLSGIVFLLLHPFHVVFCCLSISADVTLFADRVHARLWPPCIVKSTGSCFLCYEPLIKMITVQSLWHINSEQVFKPRLEPASNDQDPTGTDVHSVSIYALDPRLRPWQA